MKPVLDPQPDGFGMWDDNYVVNKSESQRGEVSSSTLVSASLSPPPAPTARKTINTSFWASEKEREREKGAIIVI